MIGEQAEHAHRAAEAVASATRKAYEIEQHNLAALSSYRLPHVSATAPYHAPRPYVQQIRNDALASSSFVPTSFVAASQHAAALALSTPVTMQRPSLPKLHVPVPMVAPPATTIGRRRSYIEIDDDNGSPDMTIID